MHVLLVSIHVKPENIDEFIHATRENVRETLKEPGVVRFDLLQQADDPTRFILFEVYRHSRDHAHHKESPHYQRWSRVAEPLLAQTRTRVFYRDVFPAESGWT